MAISLRKELNNSKVIKFPYIEFDSSQSVFVLKSFDKKSQFCVEYIPNVERGYETKEFDVFFLSNQYLNAENDIFEIYERQWNRRIGWLFPIQVLESNDNDFANNPHLNKYKYVTFKYLLSQEPTINNTYSGNAQYSITDFYNDNIIIFVISRDTIPNGSSFSIENHLPSFADYGYYTWNKEHHQLFPQQRTLALRKRGQKRLTIHQSKQNISENQFLLDLYQRHLKSANHFLLKFILLYQVIEHMMEENFDDDFKKLVDKYEQSKLSKNDLKEQINIITKERTNISSLVTKTLSNNKLVTNFQRDCKLLLDNFYSTSPNNIGDLIYNTRNLVVHRYREVLKEERNQFLLDIITQQFELVINSIVTNYEPQAHVNQ